MRRVRRNRLWHIGILFLVYSCLHVYSLTTVPPPSEESEVSTFSSNEELEATTSKEPEIELTEESGSAHPTIRPLRGNCTPPSIEQFPRPLMPRSWRRHGGLIIHVCVAIFTFLGLAIVCDDYFVSSLDRLCEGNLLPSFFFCLYCCWPCEM